ncbi:cupin domain-containing protein [Afifella pfennigii]|uniref:cupin domain-containing protein n=1 Tax=Afifella pfennigii TaxID=209897 RepID=UPI00054FEEDF|nr:cupin domain-containing protein [Afifella pfennigii]
MPFHRFESIESKLLTPHLSSGRAPIIEGRYLYFCLNQKQAGTGSELHYHPNELLIFVLKGKVNAVVGKDRRIVGPGAFLMIPPNVRHSMKATEDGDCAYLYIKDRTWTVVGIGADEAPPERALTVEESAAIASKRVSGGVSGGPARARPAGNGEASQAIVEGVPDCYYQLADAIEAPLRCASRREWLEGERCGFGFFEFPRAGELASEASPHEQFVYVLSGRLTAEVGNDRNDMRTGDIAEIGKGVPYRLASDGNTPTRFVSVHSLAVLEEAIEQAHG